MTTIHRYAAAHDEEMCVEVRNSDYRYSAWMRENALGQTNRQPHTHTTIKLSVRKQLLYVHHEHMSITQFDISINLAVTLGVRWKYIYQFIWFIITGAIEIWTVNI